jgi:hypothetical protein
MFGIRNVLEERYDRRLAQKLENTFRHSERADYECGRRGYPIDIVDASWQARIPSIRRHRRRDSSAAANELNPDPITDSPTADTIHTRSPGSARTGAMCDPHLAELQDFQASVLA